MQASEGLSTTFELLSDTENEAAAAVLISALDAPIPAIQEGALVALLKRRSLPGQREIVRRMHAIDDRWKAIIQEHHGGLSHALRDAVLDPDPQVCANGCQAILWFREYDLMPALVTALEDESNANASLAATTALSLAELFYAELAAPRDFRPKRDPQLVRRHLVAALDESVRRYGKHKRTEPVEAFLVLAGRDNATLKQILLEPLHSSYLAVIDVLTRGTRPGVVRLVLSYLDDPQAPSAALTVMAHRGDLKFIEHLLRKIGGEPSSAARHNLSRVENIAWLKAPQQVLDALDDALQPSAVALVMASGMKRLSAFETIAYLVARGKPSGRRAAAAALAGFHGAEANALVLQALKDPEPQVRATVLSQLRDRGIPGALSILIEQTESPEPVVRQAARECLSEFSFPRFLAAFDMLDAEVRRSTGTLVKRIDMQTVPLLREELLSASRRRRLRALEIAAVIETVPPVQDLVLRALHDDDHLIRVEAARALAQCESVEVQTALRQAADDSSLAVREAAVGSLDDIARRLRAAAHVIQQQLPAQSAAGQPAGGDPKADFAPTAPPIEETGRGMA